MYTWKKNLVRHLKLECDKKPQQKCPYCWFITKHKSVVKTHIYRKHKNMPNISWNTDGAELSYKFKRVSCSVLNSVYFFFAFNQ
jgi:hypothetical protein